MIKKVCHSRYLKVHFKTVNFLSDIQHRCDRFIRLLNQKHLYSITGQKILSLLSQKVNIGETIIQIPITNLSSGLYLIEVAREGQTYREKISVIR